MPSVEIAFAALGAPLYSTTPRELLVAERLEDVRSVLRAVDAATRAGAYAAGFVSYEAAPAFDEAMVVQPPTELPFAWFAIFNAPDSLPASLPNTVTPASWKLQQTRAAYDLAIARIHAAIRAGDTYQVNYTLRQEAHFLGTPFEFRAGFAHAWPAPFSAFINTGRFAIVSLSPELFFHRRNGNILTRPMKGTAPRGRFPAEDIAQAQALAASVKNRAENLMIVDLLRNDLGRIAQIGSVHVPLLFTLERYPTVWQMTSTVAATEHAATSLDDVFGALFPCGSVTGAPKISTMKLIAGLEHAQRGVYCGAIGVVLPGGEALFNVAIRTAVLDTHTGIAQYGVGGGITSDSTADDEYDEVLAKSAILRPAAPPFALLETLRLRRGRYSLRHEHVRRLADSAAFFDYAFEVSAVEAALDQHAAEHSTDRRVRLLLERDGMVLIESSPLTPPPLQPVLVACADTPIDLTDRLLFHKTTHRELYDAARAARSDVFDVMLWNQAGEVTEFTIGNLVAEIDGRCWTPPLECGLLGGVFRAALLRRGSITERRLSLADVRQARRLWLINSVRGWVEVELVT